MSTLEKAINLLQDMPEQSIEKVYNFIQVLHAQHKSIDTQQSKKSAFGIANKYENLELIEKESGAFENAMLEKYSHN